MKEIEIHTINADSLDDIHNILKKQLSFPDYYGNNLDALYDILTGEIELPLIVRWKDYKKTEKKIGHGVKKIASVFKQAAKVEKQFKIQFE